MPRRLDYASPHSGKEVMQRVRGKILRIMTPQKKTWLSEKWNKSVATMRHILPGGRLEHIGNGLWVHVHCAETKPKSFLLSYRCSGREFIVFRCLVYTPESIAHDHSINPEKSLTTTQESQSLRERRSGEAEVDAFHVYLHQVHMLLGSPGMADRRITGEWSGIRDFNS